MCAVFRPSQDGESENPGDVWLTGALWTLNRHFFGDFLCASKESYPPQAEALHFEDKQSHWIPAFAGMTSNGKVKMGPAFAGMTSKKARSLDPRLRGDDGQVQSLDLRPGLRA